MDVTLELGRNVVKDSDADLGRVAFSDQFMGTQFDDI
jgi:hypothetical protein